MTTQIKNASAFGRDMWLMLRSTFDDAAEANGYSGEIEKAQVWAGFMAAANGAMFAQVGPDKARVINDAIQVALVDVARSKLKVVKP